MQIIPVLLRETAGNAQAFWASISAFGTISAAMVALWLAGNERRRKKRGAEAILPALLEEAVIWADQIEQALLLGRKIRSNLSRPVPPKPSLDIFGGVIGPGPSVSWEASDGVEFDAIAYRWKVGDIPFKELKDLASFRLVAWSTYRGVAGDLPSHIAETLYSSFSIGERAQIDLAEETASWTTAESLKRGDLDRYDRQVNSVLAAARRIGYALSSYTHLPVPDRWIPKDQKPVWLRESKLELLGGFLRSKFKRGSDINTD